VKKRHHENNPNSKISNLIFKEGNHIFVRMLFSS